MLLEHCGRNFMLCIFQARVLKYKTEWKTNKREKRVKSYIDVGEWVDSEVASASS